MPAPKLRRKPRVRELKFKGFEGEKLVLKAKLDPGGPQREHHNIELWDGDKRLCDMHITKRWVHIFLDSSRSTAFVEIDEYKE